MDVSHIKNQPLAWLEVRMPYEQHPEARIEPSTHGS